MSSIAPTSISEAIENAQDAARRLSATISAGPDDGWTDAEHDAMVSELRAAHSEAEAALDRLLGK